MITAVTDGSGGGGGHHRLSSISPAAVGAAAATVPTPPVVKQENDACALDDDDDCDALARRWNVEIEARISLDLNLYICLACAGSKYSSRDKLNLIRHIRAKHLPDFAGHVCELCPRVLNTQRGFAAHMVRVHNVLTPLHPHPHPPPPGHVVQQQQRDSVDQRCDRNNGMPPSSVVGVKVEEDESIVADGDND
jgi:hypothetical protein